MPTTHVHSSATISWVLSFVSVIQALSSAVTESTVKVRLFLLEKQFFVVVVFVCTEACELRDKIEVETLCE